ncbi:ABC transporter substrate-binding protein [Gardnerella piotii]|uniref:ABC transporter substrate-binding protein n=1 Tax=Gardnerella piotii TaxID=2792977 RepID=UPI00200FBB67|nr:ABC transporter substrate-binding protein [Gardnerella piotii]UQA80706.1 ABC transporter substrate-binding protein [Gardnerella piotii]
MAIFVHNNLHTNRVAIAATKIAAAALAVASMVSTAACGSQNAQDPNQKTITPGVLTIGTAQPTYTPWMYDNKPENGKGYESAVAYAVAKKLGYNKDKVKWVRTTFDSAVTPGPKDFDFNLQQFSITAERKKAVDFSPSYYNATQGVVVKKDSKFANAKTLADLKTATIGAMVGTTSYSFAKDKIKSDIQTFNDNDALVQALDSKQIDALVIDTPSSVNIVRSKQVKDGVVLGQIAGSEDKEGTGLVLPKGSKLTADVTKAVNALEKDGTLKKLQEKWLADYTTNVPVLK